MIKAILFDIDGVLVDSREANRQFKKELFKQAGYNNLDPAVFEGFHKPMKVVIDEILASQNIKDEKESKRIFDMMFDPSIREVQNFKFPKDLINILQELHEKFVLGVVTSRIRYGVDEIFKLQPIEHYFDVVISLDDVENHKPHPEPLEKAISKLGLKPDEAIYIGDSDTDILAAHAIGMPSIHLAAIKHALAHHHISDFSEISDAVRFIMGKYANNNT